VKTAVSLCSTDGPEIAEIAKMLGAERRLFDPAPLASDSARSIDVVLHALDNLPEDYDAVV